ncbi:Lachesin [Folsomia candida]|uniref:Lachesin n=1 Tax=Folsomia candida TaxID=158441 RepID=A0A226F1S2_FOLCA|nr:Lachesin [Folsomia candida]
MATGNYSSKVVNIPTYAALSFMSEIYSGLDKVRRDKYWTFHLRNEDLVQQYLIVGLNLTAEDKAIIALHNHMVTNNHRFSVTHNGHSSFTLNIRHVQTNDTGEYLCQINTDPQRSQSGTLEVVVPADIIDEETSNDVVVLEGQSAILKCKARGIPVPKVRWIRQDRRPLPLSKDLLANPTEKVGSSSSSFCNGIDIGLCVETETWQTRPLQRSDTGAVLCIANNSIPPLRSKKITLSVHFHPLIKVSNQLVAAPAGVNMTLECYVESVPRPVCSWYRRDGHSTHQLILNQVGKLWQETEQLKEYSLKMKLTITNLQSSDFGEYNCSVENSLGGDSAVIKLHELPPVTTRTTTTPQPDWRKHGKHGNDGNTIKHSKDKRKQGRNRSEHYHRDYDFQEGDAEQLTTSTSLASLNAITAVGVGGAGGGTGLSKRNQKEGSISNTRLHNSPDFPGAATSSSTALITTNNAEDKLHTLFRNVWRFANLSKCCLPLSLIPNLSSASFTLTAYLMWKYSILMLW